MFSWSDIRSTSCTDDDAMCRAESRLFLWASVSPSTALGQLSASFSRGLSLCYEKQLRAVQPKWSSLAHLHEYSRQLFHCWPCPGLLVDQAKLWLFGSIGVILTASRPWSVLLAMSPHHATMKEKASTFECFSNDYLQAWACNWSLAFSLCASCPR